MSEMTDIPDFEQIASIVRNIVVISAEGDAFVAKAQRDAIVEQLRQVWNARGAANADLLRRALVCIEAHAEEYAAARPLAAEIARGAKALGVSRPALSNLLNGRADLSGDMALRIEKAFCVRMGHIAADAGVVRHCRTRLREKSITVRRYRAASSGCRAKEAARESSDRKTHQSGSSGRHADGARRARHNGLRTDRTPNRVSSDGACTRRRVRLGQARASRRPTIVSTSPRSAAEAIACAAVRRARSSRKSAGTSSAPSSASIRSVIAASVAPVAMAPRNDAFSAAVSFGSAMVPHFTAITLLTLAVTFWSEAGM